MQYTVYSAHTLFLLGAAYTAPRFLNSLRCQLSNERRIIRATKIADWCVVFLWVATALLQSSRWCV